MKEIKLMNLTLNNFKGIKYFTIDLNGEDIRVFGDNSTGKTTLMDAFNWLLFNKDSNNRSDFAIKTLLNGKEINNLDHEVEASFLIDGQPLTLHKVYKEKWTKKRGAPMAEFTGHETNHHIDGVPVKKKEYTEKVDSIVKEEVFKLLTSPTFFPEQLKWQDQRATVIEVSGDVEDEDVFAYNSKLKGLPAVLNGRTIEDHKKVIAARRSEINKELTSIPVRIDEINNSLPKEAIDLPTIEKKVSVVEKKIDESTAQINNIKNGSAVIGKQNELRQIEMDLESIKRELESESVEQGFKVQTKIQEEQSNISNLNRKKDDAEHLINTHQKDISSMDEGLKKLRERWSELNVKEYTHTHENDGVCPTCSQDLPVAEIQAAKEKAVAAFNLSKSNELVEINTKGKNFNVDKENTLEQIENLNESVLSVQSHIDAKTSFVSELSDKLNSLREAVKNARQDTRYQSKLQEQLKVSDAVIELKDSAESAVVEIEKEVAQLRAQRNELNEQVAQQAQVKSSNKRIGELEEKQKELAAEFEKLEGELFLTEEFTRSKVELLTEKINAKFKHARFKLFDTQINGGITEVCEVTYLGVPYSSGLNSAARINVGLDICSTLQKHYGIKVPIWIDNSESVVELLDIDTQMISLSVSGKDKQLRIEKQSDKEVGAA